MHAFSKIPSARHLIFKYRASKTQKFFFIFSRAAYKFLNFCRTLSTVNISEMADKEKRLRKILDRRGLKGKLKSVKTLQEAYVICLDSEESISKALFMGKDTYIRFLEMGHTFLEDQVHYLISSNPRNARNIERQILTVQLVW